MKDDLLKNKKPTQTITVRKEFEGLRLDIFLAKIQMVQTRSQALKLISKNQVSLNNSPLKASYRLSQGDLLTVTLPFSKQKENLSPYHFPLDILFEDEEILVVNKPAGLVVHPAPGHEEKTLVNILFHQKNLSPGSHPLRPGVVHRLDKDTSGLLVLAKTKASQDHLIQQFKEHHIHREYWAVSLCPPSPFQGKIETWMARHPVHRKKFISLKEFQPASKKAISFYQMFRQHDSGLSWIKCHLQTGRTHQIRVHLSSISCPIAGDKIYGGQTKRLSSIKDLALKEMVKNLTRIALHAQGLGFIHPLSGKSMTFRTPWPFHLKALLEKLDFYKE